MYIRIQNSFLNLKVVSVVEPDTYPSNGTAYYRIKCIAPGGPLWWLYNSVEERDADLRRIGNLLYQMSLPADSRFQAMIEEYSGLRLPDPPVEKLSAPESAVAGRKFTFDNLGLVPPGS